MYKNNIYKYLSKNKTNTNTDNVLTYKLNNWTIHTNIKANRKLFLCLK